MGDRRKGKAPERKSESKKSKNIRQVEGQNAKNCQQPLGWKCGEENYKSIGFFTFGSRERKVRFG